MHRHVGFTVASLFAALLAMACAGEFDPANFEGSREAQRAQPEAIGELRASTTQLETLGIVHDSCKLRPGFRRLEGEALSDLDCSTERLTWALRETAARNGGQVLVGLRCSSRRLDTGSADPQAIDCSGAVARYKGGVLADPGRLNAPGKVGTPAPSAAEVRRLEQPDASLGFRIALDFEPAVPAFTRRSRTPAEVKELVALPIADFRLGDLAASCNKGCDERALRYGVLIAAGRLGAADVIGVRCFSTRGGNSCVGTLAAPTLDE